MRVVRSWLGMATLGTSFLVSCTAQDESAELATDLPQIAQVCADGPTLPGIDVSEWQGDIDWDAVAASGIKFAIIRTGDGRYQDSKFAYNWQRAREVGIARGVYHYFQTHIDPVEQANIMLNMMGPMQDGDLPPTIDLEDPSGIPDAQTYMDMVNRFGDRVEEVTGLTPFAYSNWSYPISKFGSHPDLARFPYWMAYLDSGCPDLPAPWQDWTLWQSSWEGSVPGIAGHVDLDVFNGDLTALQNIGYNSKPAVCGNNTCERTESTDSCAQDCPPCQWVNESGETVLDDTGSCFVGGGDPTYLRHENVGWEATHTWTHTTEQSSASNFGQWNVTPRSAGRLNVSVYIEPGLGESRQARYQVIHNGQVSVVMVDQSASPGWNSLGEFDFAAGGLGQMVRVDDNTGETNASETRLAFDAVKLTALNDGNMGVKSDSETADGDEANPGDTMTTSGCQSASGGGLAGVMMMLGLWLVASKSRVSRQTLGS